MRDRTRRRGAGRRCMSVSVSAPRLERHSGFQSRFLARARDLVVYLPPGYDDDRHRRYPVLYMNDGQNLFDPADLVRARTVTGAWARWPTC